MKLWVYAEESTLLRGYPKTTGSMYTRDAAADNQVFDNCRTVMQTFEGAFRFWPSCCYPRRLGVLWSSHASCI